MAEITAPCPLAEADDRSCFDCGRESIDLWFQRHAWANHVVGISRTVICDAATSEIIGRIDDFANGKADLAGSVEPLAMVKTMTTSKAFMKSFTKWPPLACSKAASQIRAERQCGGSTPCRGGSIKTPLKAAISG